MTPSQEEALARIRLKARRLDELRREPRYRRVIEHFVALGALETNEQIIASPRKHVRKLAIDDVLFAGEIEPRILEVFPTLFHECPELFVSTRRIPEDLTATLDAIRFGRIDGQFRGIPWARILRHHPRFEKKAPAKLHSFRLKKEDERLLEYLSERLGLSRTDVLRSGLRSLAEKLPP